MSVNEEGAYSEEDKQALYGLLEGVFTVSQSHGPILHVSVILQHEDGFTEAFGCDHAQELLHATSMAMRAAETETALCPDCGQPEANHVVSLQSEIRRIAGLN